MPEPGSQVDPAQIAVVVPAYNEARLIGRTLRAMPGVRRSIVVVDDGSVDGTRQASRALRAIRAWRSCARA